MIISKYYNKQILVFINFFKNLGNDSYNLLGRWCHKGIPTCNESVINKKIYFALLDNSLCTKTKEINRQKIKSSNKKSN
jgi:hypothetical protein